jgi:hypothetical protein
VEYFHHFILRRCSQPLLPPKFYDRPLCLNGIWFLLVVWRLLQIARL